MKVPFQTVDVFTDRKFGGNPLAVIPDARGLTTEQMQSIAAEFNLAETTFVLPPKDPKNTAQVRIFTPKSEMPFAGHPNVGTAFVLARMGRATGDRLVFEEKAGLVPLDLTRQNGTVVAARLAAPQPLTSGEKVAPEIVAQAVGLAPADIVGQPMIASTGNNFLFAEVRSRETLKAASYNIETFRQHLPMERTVGVHLYVTGADIQSRMFAPLFGVPEDPATGSANITLIGLLALREPQPDLTFTRTIGQGVDMGRPSVLEATAEKKGGKIVAAYIGGRCVPMLSGTIDLT
ncbi:MAG: PhzF family phenazine biosynthesis protein [Reyranella sp.]|uniref:PhzF family phenazine biosynthesis protein n=1 Tax=Reyranella sp. TaxID=1929291 RepID=UPI001ACEEA8A|nr:PhzF family phenazine biosynthesis protein [Reyranella sp.]MBN9091438.1 PhzF family phenazine biosynthesis protein [Reyranella sp.]